ELAAIRLLRGARSARRLQELAERAARAPAYDEVLVAKACAFAWRRRDEEPARLARLLVVAEAPRRAEAAVGLLEHLLDDRRIEHLAADCHPLSQVVEHLGVDRLADGGRCETQHIGRGREQLLVGG